MMMTTAVVVITIIVAILPSQKLSCCYFTFYLAFAMASLRHGAPDVLPKIARIAQEYATACDVAIGFGDKVFPRRPVCLPDPFCSLCGGPRTLAHKCHCDEPASMRRRYVARVARTQSSSDGSARGSRIIKLQRKKSRGLQVAPIHKTHLIAQKRGIVWCWTCCYWAHKLSRKLALRCIGKRSPGAATVLSRLGRSLAPHAFFDWPLTEKESLAAGFVERDGGIFPKTHL